jgi:hypothetical protein
MIGVGGVGALAAAVRDGGHMSSELPRSFVLSAGRLSSAPSPADPAGWTGFVPLFPSSPAAGASGATHRPPADS